VSKKIVNVLPFYIVREGLSDGDVLNVKPKLDHCDVGFLKPSEIKVISASPEVPETEDDLLERLSRNCLCLGIKHHGEIAAYMWCNLQECDSNHIKFKLRKDEAYLFDARTFRSYRGKNLAPYIRIELYRHLRQMGLTRFISITEYFNTSARRFKEKLNAKPQKLFMCIKFFMKYKWVLLLKSYEI